MASTNLLQSIHIPWVDMMTQCSSFCHSLSRSAVFLKAVVDRLQTTDAMVLCSLLKIIRMIHVAHPCPRSFVLDYNLYVTVSKFAESEDQVLPYQVANKLLIDFQQSTFS